MDKKSKKITVSLINPYILNNNGKNIYKISSHNSVEDTVKELYNSASKHFSNSILNKNFCISVKVIDENKKRRFYSYAINDIFNGGSSKNVKYTIEKLKGVDKNILKKIDNKK